MADETSTEAFVSFKIKDNIEAFKAGVVPTGPDGTVDPRYELAVALKKLPNYGVKEICKAVGIGQLTYYQWFPATRGRINREYEVQRLREMHKLRDQGWSDAAIGREFKCSRARVGALLGKRGKIGGNGLQTVKWRATVDQIYKVKVAASKVGAAIEDGKNEASIPLLLEMIAEGQLIVTAPPTPARQKLGPDSR